MAYISLDDFLAWPGVDVSQYDDTTEEGPLQVVLELASGVVDAETDTTWDFRVIPNEELPWIVGDGSTWRFETDILPVRTVLSATIVRYVDFDYQDIPDVVDLSKVQILDNTIVSRWLPFPNRSGVAGLPYVTQLDPPLVKVSYTAGYDDGTIQSDGLSFPYPRWLRDATRLIARSIIEQDILNENGLGGIEMLRVGQVEIRKKSQGMDVAIPNLAKMLLDNAPTRSYEIVLR